ncbi:thiolase family protein [Nocardia donostiensis]|uniref:Thiolase n=1 Tax=Nocardia donostiensis TaxID=1538463 RepID=A0A1V2TG49_9NOCA|nr:thiolase family protein [Nocardia donostiensis]ONM48443.1 thiolase [Nocardia donostiensis]OQS16168.1 thiolase [Nocardia donostiensis]OQS18590.1 thiolase [Nocardia donostiensis]
MRDVVVVGCGMTAFGKQPARTVSGLAAEAVESALADAGLGSEVPAELGMIYYANVLSGLLQGQESARGQNALARTGVAGIPLVNVENACASGSTALHQAWLSVASGQVDAALAVGVEKLHIEDKARALSALTSVLDQEHLPEVLAELGSSGTGSVFMDFYAGAAKRYMERTGATQEDFARITVKNSEHGSRNPKAQYGKPLTIDEVLSARCVSGPLTVPMCAPMSDGAAAVLVAAPELARRWEADGVYLRGTVVTGGRRGVLGELVPTAAARAFEQAGIGPEDVDVVECHDAAAPAELIVLEELGLCGPGEALTKLRAGATRIGGELPVNPSGGLQSKGHPLGATGLGQVVELVDQLRGRAGARQVGEPRVALAENAGGYMGPDAAVATVTILSR